MAVKRKTKKRKAVKRVVRRKQVVRRRQRAKPIKMVGAIVGASVLHNYITSGKLLG